MPFLPHSLVPVGSLKGGCSSSILWLELVSKNTLGVELVAFTTFSNWNCKCGAYEADDEGEGDGGEGEVHSDAWAFVCVFYL